MAAVALPPTPATSPAAPSSPPTCPQPDQAPGEFAKLLDEAQAPDVAVKGAADDEALNEAAVTADPALAVSTRDAVVDPAALLANLAAAQYTAAPNQAAQRTTADALKFLDERSGSLLDPRICAALKSVVTRRKTLQFLDASKE